MCYKESILFLKSTNIRFISMHINQISYLIIQITFFCGIYCGINIVGVCGASYTVELFLAKFFKNIQCKL